MWKINVTWHLMILVYQGNYLEALECMERGLVLRQHFFGAESDEVWSACKTVGEMCNLLAMTYLQQEDFNMVLELLKKAEILTERDLPGRAATYNNLACYYRRQGKLHPALKYLQKVRHRFAFMWKYSRSFFHFSLLLAMFYFIYHRHSRLNRSYPMSKTPPTRTSMRARCCPSWADTLARWSMRKPR